MSSQQKFTIDMPVVLGFIALIVLLALAQAYLVPPAQPPAPADGQARVITHYVGDAALELPESWTMDSMQAVFYLTDKPDGPQIIFKEKPAKAGQDAAEELAKNLKIITGLKKSNDLRQAGIGRTDLSEALGRPALIHIKEARSGGNSFGLSVVSAYTYSRPPGNRLDMTLELATPQAGLIFEYTEALEWPADKDKSELLADKQKILADWALAFIDSFECTGYNSPQPRGFLATKFGRIDIRKKWKYHYYTLTARFSQKTSSLRVSDISFSLSSLPAEAPSCGRDTARQPAGPLGTEVRKTATGLNSERLDLSWQNCSNSRLFSPREPSFKVAYCGYAIDRDVLDEAEIMAMWDGLIKSLRILPGSD